MEITFPLARMWGMLVRADPVLPAFFRQPQMVFSYPMLGSLPECLQISWFVYPAELDGQGLTIRRPLAIVRACWLDQKIERIESLQNPPEFETLGGTFPFTRPPALEKTAPTSTQVFAAYTPLLELFPQKPAGDAGKALVGMLEAVVHPALLPFHRATAPAFLDWLEGGQIAPS